MRGGVGAMSHIAQTQKAVCPSGISGALESSWGGT